MAAVLGGVGLALAVGALIAWSQVRTMRAASLRARTDARELDARLERFLAEVPIHEQDEVEPVELAREVSSTAARVGAREFQAAPVEELALTIRLGAAEREAGDRSGSRRRLEAALERARAARPRFLDSVVERTPPDPELVPYAQMELARTLIETDEVPRALELARAAAETSPTREALEHRTSVLAERLLVLAQAYERSGDATRAVESARRALEHAPAVDPRFAPWRWTGLQLLVRDAKGRGARSESISLQRSALAVAREHFAPDDPRTATSRYELAFELHDEGPLFVEEALREYRAALDVRLARAHGDTLEIAEHLSNYALLLKQSNRPREAEPLMVRALEIRARVVPGDDVGTATMTNNVGTLRHALGDQDGAEAMLEAALAMRRRLFPDGHSDVAQTLQNLAYLKRLKREYPASIRHGREALAILRRSGPKPNLDVAIALDNLGITLSDAEQYEEAETLVREALAIEGELGLVENATRAQTLDNLAVILYYVDRYDEAAKHAAESVAIRRALFGGVHPDLAESRRHLAWIEKERGNLAEALVQYRGAITALGGGAEGLAAVPDLTFEMGRCLAAAGELPHAVEAFRAVLAVWVRNVGERTDEVADLVENLAWYGVQAGLHAQIEADLVNVAEQVLATRGIAADTRERIVKALIGTYQSWTGDGIAVERAWGEARGWQRRLDEYQGF